MGDRLATIDMGHGLYVPLRFNTLENYK